MRDYFSFKAKEILGKRSVKKGDVILTSKPFAYVIDSQHRGKYCDNCLASSSLKTLKACKVCGFLWYCSDYCAIVGSDIHKYECRPLKRMGSYEPPNFARLLMRVIIRLKNGGEKYADFYCDKKSRKFKDLMNHYRDIRNDEKRMRDIRSMRKVLVSLMGERNLPPESDFIGLYGRVLVNRFCLMDAKMCPIGSSLYLGGSIFDHSCIPNAYASFEETNLVVRSLVDWKELDLNKVFISYIDLLNGTFYRRAELRANWYFWCECSLCTDKDRIAFENCIKCENPECRLPVLVPERPESLFVHTPAPDPECSFCGWVVEEDRLEEYHSAVAFTRQRLRALNENSPAMDLCLTVMERQGENFSSMNVWRVRAIDCAFNAAYCNGFYASALDYGKRNIEAMRIYYQPYHPTLGLFLLKLAKTLLYLKEYKEGLELANEAEEILVVALGPDHYLVKEEITSLKMMANEDVEIHIQARLAEKEKQEHEMVCRHCGRRKNNFIPNGVN